MSTTSFPIYTAQLNLGKRLKLSNNIAFVDITQRSGDGILARFFAPTWDIIRTYKDDHDWDKFTTAYQTLLSSRDDTLVKVLLNNLIKAGGLNGVVFGCYCGDVSHCHRILAVQWIVDNLDAVEYRGEINASNLTVTRQPAKNVVALLVAAEDYGDVEDTLNRSEYLEKGVVVYFRGLRSVRTEALDNLHAGSKLLIPSLEVRDKSTVIIDCSDSDDTTIQEPNALKDLIGYISLYTHPMLLHTLKEIDEVINRRSFCDHVEINVKVSS